MKLKIKLGLSSLLLISVIIAATKGPNTTELTLPISEKETVLDTLTAFDKMMMVLTHKRCVNCHPNDNIPKQGEDSHPHYFDMERGQDNLGFQATKCTTCHQSENNNYSGVPGVPEWSLAPASMFWEGLSRTEIAKSMMDPIRNGNRTPEETMHHLTEHELVLWAWEPGKNIEGITRELPPVPKDEYIAAVKKWFEEGHIIPSK